MKFSGMATAEFIAWHRILPQDTDGGVKDPRLVPPHRQSAYREAWRAWARLNPPKEWPDFLHAMALETKVKHEKAQTQA